jgi:hypothetical protein
MEKTVSDLIEESCLAYEQNDTKLVRIYVIYIHFAFIFFFRHLKKLKKQ